MSALLDPDNVHTDWYKRYVAAEQMRDQGHLSLPHGHWCLIARKFNGFGRPDVCPYCWREFPENPPPAGVWVEGVA